MHDPAIRLSDDKIKKSIEDAIRRHEEAIRRHRCGAPNPEKETHD